MKLNKIIISFVSALAILLSTSITSFAKVVGDKIVLGSAISLTGKYSSNGVHTQNGYNMAVDRINSMGGVKVGGKTYKFEIIYYDDESNPKRAAQLAERLIKQDGVEYMLGPYSSGLTKAIALCNRKIWCTNGRGEWSFKIVVYKRLQVFICGSCAQLTYILM